MRRSLLFCSVGLLSGLTFAAAPPPTTSESGTIVQKFLARFDRNKDGFLTRNECPPPLMRAFDRVDTNADGKLSPSELTAIEDRLARILTKGSPGRPGEVITPAAKGERQKNSLRVGDVAPDFSLPSIDGKTVVKLSSFRGKKPVVLIFASYT